MRINSYSSSMQGMGPPIDSVERSAEASIADIWGSMEVYLFWIDSRIEFLVIEIMLDVEERVKLSVFPVVNVWLTRR